MPRILVPPEVLLAVSDQFSRASEQLEMNQNTLNQQITMMMHSWDGTTKQRFFEDFQRARSEMKLTVKHMLLVSQELKQIAFKFITADGMNKLGDPNGLTALLGVPPNSCPADYPEPESSKTVLVQLEEQAEELWDGMVSGAKILGGSIASTASSFIEDPIGTGGQMFYDATVGTAEEIIDTTVWGTKMIFDVGDTREKFDERLSAEQEKVNDMGMAEYIGEKGALILGGVALNRIGVKSTPRLKHDANGDGGGPSRKDEGTGKAPDSTGKFVGNINELKPAERKVANDLIAEGKTVERIPESTKHGEKKRQILKWMEF